MIKISKIYIPLVERLIKLDNYEKIKAVVEIGMLGLDFIEEYNLNNSTKLNPQIRQQISEMNDKITNMVEEKANMKQHYLNEMREIEEKYKNKLDKLRDETFEIKKSNIDNLKREGDRIRKEFFENLKKIEESKNVEISYLKDMIKNNREVFENEKTRELDLLKRESEKMIEELKKENKRFKDKYERLEINSVLKGKPYEDAIEQELKDYFERNNNIYSIENCSNKTGKGDYVITNNYSGIRIMLEAKNMPCVSSTVKEQQPKFYSDLKDKTNNYDGGFIVTMGRVEGKKNYDIEVLDNKVVSFIENYSLNEPEKIYLILEVIHGKIMDLKSQKNLSERQILESQVEIYKRARESYKKVKVSYDSQSELLMKIKDNILEMFKIDVEEYIVDKNKGNKVLSENIVEKIEDFINVERKKNENITKIEITKKIYDEFNDYIELFKTDRKNGVSKQKISKIIKKNYEKDQLIIEMS